MTDIGFSLDAGALVAIERGDARVRSLVARALRLGTPIHVVPEVVAQVWRGGHRQARLATFLAAEGVRFPQMTFDRARAVGILCGRAGHHDVVDVYVALEASQAGHHVVTSDADDLRQIDPSLRLIEV